MQLHTLHGLRIFATIHGNKKVCKKSVTMKKEDSAKLSSFLLFDKKG